MSRSRINKAEKAAKGSLFHIGNENNETLKEIIEEYLGNDCKSIRVERNEDCKSKVLDDKGSFSSESTEKRGDRI